jgi:hypothetical protein
MAVPADIAQITAEATARRKQWEAEQRSRPPAMPADPDRIAELVSPEGPADAHARELALKARHRRAQARERAEFLHDQVMALASRLAGGEVREEQVLAAVRERDDARAMLEVWNAAVRHADSHAAVAGRR